MNKEITPEDIQALARWKKEDTELQKKRTELFVRLHDAGFSFQYIAEIYGCTRQYVQQEYDKHNAQA